MSEKLILGWRGFWDISQRVYFCYRPRLASLSREGGTRDLNYVQGWTAPFGNNFQTSTSSTNL